MTKGCSQGVHVPGCVVLLPALVQAHAVAGPFMPRRTLSVGDLSKQ